MRRPRRWRGACARRSARSIRSSRALLLGLFALLALVITATGIAGLLGALALNRVMAGLLYGIEPTDPVTYVGVSLVLLAVAALACWMPARRATGIHPMLALRKV